MNGINHILIKSLYTYLSAASTLNPFLLCEKQPIEYLIEKSMENVETSTENIEIHPDDVDSQLGSQFAYILQEFAKNYNYVGIVDPKDIIIPNSAPEGSVGFRLPEGGGNWGVGYVVDYGTVGDGKAPLYHDRDILDHSPGFSSISLFDGHKDLSKEQKSTFNKLKEMSDLDRLEVQLNCILRDKNPRLNSLVLGACLYCAAKKLNADAFIVHSNLGNNKYKFDPQNSRTSVIIKTSTEILMVTFKSDKKVSISIDPDKSTVFPAGSYLYFTGKVSRYGLEKDWNLSKNLSLDNLQMLINKYNEDLKNGIINESYNMADFMGMNSYLLK